MFVCCVLLRLCEPHSRLGDAVYVRSSLCLMHLVFHCHRIEGYRLLSGHKRAVWVCTPFVYVCVCVCFHGWRDMFVSWDNLQPLPSQSEQTRGAGCLISAMFFFSFTCFSSPSVCVCVQQGLLKTGRQLLWGRFEC